MESGKELRDAAHVGDVKKIIRLLNRGVDVDAVDEDGETVPLMRASNGGHLECVKELLAQVNIQDEDGWTALMMASRHGHLECLKELLDRGAQVNVQSKDGWTALMRASRQGHLECLKELLDRDAQMNVQTKDGWTALMEASYFGHLECMKELLDRDAQVNVQNKDGWTALMMASNGGKLECLKELLNRDAQVNVQDKHGETALMWASNGGHLECVKELLNWDAQVNVQTKDGWTALMRASREGHLECLKELLDRGAQVNVQTKDGWIALMGASNGGRLECLKELLNRDAQVNVQDKDGWTALMRASREGHLECMKELLNRGAQVNVQTKDGDTALHLAAKRGHEKCVRLLLSIPGMSATVVNHRGLTPLKLATSYDVITMLRKYTTSCEDFPVHTYGKVIMCGDSGAGKSTLTEAIIHCSESMSEGGFNQHHAKRTNRKPVKALTAGIISHRVKSPKANVTIYDLAGHREYYSSHSSILELISKTTPSVFLLLVNLLLSLEQIIAQIYFWSAMIGNVCNKCPQQSAIIVVGTHADCLKDKKKLESLSMLLPKLAQDAMKQLTFVQFTALNVTSFNEELDDFMLLLHRIIDDVRMKCPAISLNCHLMYAFLNDKVLANQDVISLFELITLLDREDPKFLPTEAAEVSKLLKTLSEKGFIVFFDNNLADSWIVLHQDVLMEKVNGVLFAPAHFDEHIPIASNTGVIPISVLKSRFPNYNIDMITQFLIQFELCQPITVAPCNATHQGPPSISYQDLFFPPLVSASRPDDVTIPSDAFCWQMCTTSINQSFSPRFLHVLVRRIADQFPLPTRDICLDPDLQQYNRRCTVWIRGISWRSEEGFTTVIEMKEDFRCLQCAVSTYDKKDTNYSHLVASVINVISKTCDEFCPSVSRVESITCPPEATSDQIATTVECEVLKKILLNKSAQVIDSTGKKEVIVNKWKEKEPQLPILLGLDFKNDPITATLTEADHALIFQSTKSAKGQWRAIGGELGFTIDELDSIVREPGRHGDEDYYAAMLRRWLDWAPPNHTHPFLQSLLSALRAVGKEREANDLEAKYKYTK